MAKNIGDCIVFATGFEVGTDYSRRAGYQINGVDGLTVSQKWSDGLSTFHGMHSRGFPTVSFRSGPVRIYRHLYLFAG